MTTEEIINGNKTIAEFMSYKIWYRDGTEVCVEISPERVQPITEWAKYHSSWDWLMPVCKKFDTLLEGKYVVGRKWVKTYTNLCDNIDEAVSCYEISPVWERIVEAIQWYNKKFNQNK